MRILHVVNDVQTGGAQTLIEALGRASPVGTEQHLLVLMGPGALSARLESAMTSVRYVGLGRRNVFPLSAIVSLQKMVRTHNIDVVHSHLLQSDLVSLLSPLRTPRISTLHTSGNHESGRIARAVGRTVALLSWRLSAVAACSASARHYAVARNYRDAESVLVIHNGTAVSAEAPPSRWPVVPARPETNNGASLRLLHLARWHPMKDHSTLFAALAIVKATHPEIRLDCAGLDTGPGNQELADLVVRHGVKAQVTLHGSVANVAPLMAAAFALVISSSHGEALPMAGLEALSAALPVISTDVGDCRELVIDPDNLVEPGNPAQLAAAINRMIAAAVRSGDTEYTRWRQQSWELAREKFDRNRAAAAYGRLYESVSPPQS